VSGSRRDGFALSDRVTSVAPSGIRRLFQLGKSMDDPIDLSMGQPDFDPPEDVRRAAVDAIESGRNRYTVTQGIEPLREALRERYAHRCTGLATGEEDVMVTSGASGAIVIAYLALLDPGDEVLIPDPYFVVYRTVASLVGATPVMYDTYPDFRIDPDKVRAGITDRTRAIVVNSPTNPTGHALDEREARELAAIADETQIPLISDEIYEDFVYEGRHVSPREYTHNCLVIAGASKSLGMPGLRVGWMIGPTRFVERCHAVQQYTFVCAPAPGQWAALAGSRVDPGPYRAAYTKKRDLIVNGLDESYRVVKPRGAFFAFPQIPQGIEPQRFLDACIEQQLLIVPGSAFSTRATHFRLSFAAADAKLLQAVEVLNSIAADQVRDPRSG
jgi:aspartate aminotransferase/aminotransferase